MRTGSLLLVGSLLSPTLMAQQSASYTLDEHHLNQGGSPDAGGVPSSGSYAISLDAIGVPVHAAGLSSASYLMDAGFVVAYPPPGEVLDLVFTDATTLAWTPEPSVGAYDVYRGLAGSLPGGYGDCFASAAPGEIVTDAELPPPGACYFYLVTATNRIGEEGTKGYDSLGAERANPAPCK